MATLLQYFRKPVIRSVTVISGPDEVLRSMAQDELVLQLGVDSSWIECYDISDGVRSLVERISMPSFSHGSLLICTGIQSLQDRSFFTRYLDHVVPGISLCLVASAIRDKERQRWIPSDSRVLYIDCGYLDEDGLVELGKQFKLTDEAARWLVEATAGDTFSMVRALELFDVVPGTRNVSYCKRLVQYNASNSLFSEYSLPPYDGDLQLCRAIKRRFEQLIALSQVMARASRLPFPDLAEQSGIPIFILGKLMPLAKTKPASYWMKAFALSIQAEQAALYGNQGAGEFLYEAIRSI